jgi:hypothetical protein
MTAFVERAKRQPTTAQKPELRSMQWIVWSCKYCPIGFDSPQTAKITLSGAASLALPLRSIVGFEFFPNTTGSYGALGNSVDTERLNG